MYRLEKAVETMQLGITVVDLEARSFIPIWLMSEIVKDAHGEPCAIVTELFTFDCLLKYPVSGQLQESYLRKL